jgi:predicted nucleic acid-binding protein
MILVDTSVWIDHLRNGDPVLGDLLDKSLALTHPLVIGELAMGNLRNRDVVLQALRDIPAAVVAADDEVLAYISRRRLHGLGIGFIDAHLLAAVQLTAGAKLWTRDMCLHDVATRLGIGAQIA